MIKPNYLLLTLEFPPFKGGIANYLFALCNNLPSKNLIALAPQLDTSSSFDETVDFKIKRIPLAKLGIKYITPIFTLFMFGFYTPYIVFKEGVKGIFCNHFFPLGIVGYLMKKFFGIPYALIFHGRELSKLSENGFEKWLGIKILKGAERMIVNSNYTKNELVKFDIETEKRIVVLYPGIQFSRFISSVATNGIKDLSIIDGRRVLLTVARLVPYKGIDMVISSLRYVIGEFPNLIYLVVGEGRDRKRLEEIVMNEGLNNNVIFLGKISDEDIIKYYQNCDVCLLISRDMEGETIEGFGISFLEANACGKPVIGGNSGGVSDAVIDGETGFLVDPSDLLMIARKIIELLRDKDLAYKFGTNGRKRVERLFDWEKRGVELENIFNINPKAREFYSNRETIHNK